MADVAATRRERWVPPARPDWVAQVNREGTYLDIKSIVPLDAASLIETAKRNTGLADFGIDDWREAFEVICRGFDEESALTLMGRIMTRSDMLMFLEGRLRIEEAYRLHPEIEDEQIAAPILILGQGRSGTSALFNLLACDPGNVAPRSWQAMLPGLPHEGTGPDPRIELADKRITMWERVTPEVAAAHEFTAEIPTENIHLEALSFQSPSWQAIFGQNPSHYAYMHGKSMRPAVEYGRRLLKLLQWRATPRQWVMKSPDALNYLPDVVATYPDLRVVWIHRDPVVSLSSMVTLVGTLAYVRSDAVLSEGTFDAVASPDGAAQMLTRPIDWIEAGLLRRDHLVNVQYGDFVEDPVGTAAAVYQQLGMTMTPAARAAMTRYMASHPRDSRPKLRYDTGSAADISAERAVFGRYQSYFGVPSEV